ncbi:hypothetical protein ACFCX0_48005, partial [Streptomyces sp. NPDC056352]
AENSGAPRLRVRDRIPARPEGRDSLRRSGMDPRGEHQIFEQIKAIAASRITIVVTHRLENTKIAEHIVVIEHGRITEQGRYDDLVHAGGAFAELLQLSQDR